MNCARHRRDTEGVPRQQFVPYLPMFLTAGLRRRHSPPFTPHSTKLSNDYAGQKQQPSMGRIPKKLCGGSSDRRLTLRSGQPQANKRKCGIQPAHQGLLTDVFGSHPLPCTIHRSNPTSRQSRWEGLSRPLCLTWDIRVSLFDLAKFLRPNPIVQRTGARRSG